MHIKLKLSTESKETSLVNYLFVLMLLGNKSDIVGKPIYFPLNGAIFVWKLHLWVEQQS